MEDESKRCDKKNFAALNLHKSVQETLKENGFIEMTSIQQRTIPSILSKKDVIVQSHTGSGKTLCFVIPLVEEIIKKNLKGIVGLVISPTRELAIQTNDVFNTFSVQSSCFIGGIDLENDMEAIKNCSVVVGTPGRLFEIVKHNHKLFSNLSRLILDEADELVSLGFSEKVLDIISLLPKKRTTSLFSATINEGVQKLSMNLLKNPINISGEERPEELRIRWYEILPENKLRTTLSLIKGKKCIVFFSTCNQVDFFFSLISNLKEFNLLKIHGKMKQEERSKVYKEFENSNCVLFCTDVAARGIDFKDIERIIHFDVPKEYNTLIHRSGRTARNGKEGEAILFVMPNEMAYIEYLKIKNVEINSFEFSETCVDIPLKSYMNETTLDLSVKAFVSYIRSYKEHNLNYILDFQTLDYDSIAELFMLEKIPGMFELKNVKFKKFVKPEAKTEKPPKKKIVKKKTFKKEEPPVVKRKSQQHKKKRIKCEKDRRRKKK